MEPISAKRLWTYLTIACLALSVALQVVGTTTIISKIGTGVLLVFFIARLISAAALRDVAPVFKKRLLIGLDLCIIFIMLTSNQWFSIWPETAPVLPLFVAFNVLSLIVGLDALTR
jgi:hypothetical protein